MVIGGLRGWGRLGWWAGPGAGMEIPVVMARLALVLD